MSEPHGRDWGLRILGGVGALLVAGGIALVIVINGDNRLDTIGPSMKPTLQGREKLDVDTGAYDEATPQIGDIITAQGPEGIRLEACAEGPEKGSPCARSGDGYSTIRVVKRVVGLPGDEIAFAPDGTVIRNGEKADEPYILKCYRECGLPNAITVPDGYYFIAGDNRPVSSDSRYWGAIPLEAIDGKVSLPG